MESASKIAMLVNHKLSIKILPEYLVCSPFDFTRCTVCLS